MITAYINLIPSAQAVLPHTFNTSTQEVEADEGREDSSCESLWHQPGLEFQDSQEYCFNNNREGNQKRTFWGEQKGALCNVLWVLTNASV